MAQVDLTIGGNSYTVACRDGEEARLASLAALVDAKASDARRSVGGVSEARLLLFAALLLADELDETRKSGGATLAPSPVAPHEDEADLLEEIATRLESIVQRLEKRG